MSVHVTKAGIRVGDKAVAAGARAAVDAGAPLRQGGDLRGLGRGRQPYLDVGTCVNRYGPPPTVAAALAAMDPRELLTHPYSAAQDFLVAYADHLGVDPEQMVAGRGITEFIHLLSEVLPREQVAVVTPDYTDTIRTFPLHLEPPPGVVDTAQTRMQRVAAGMRLHPYVLLSNPNNPLGVYIHPDHLVDVCRQYPDSTLIVDEAFIGFTASNDRLSMIHRGMPNVVVLRSPNKLFGIAGVRTGALWTHNARLRAAVRARTLNWSISHMDSVVARAALQSNAWAEQTRTRLLRSAAEMERLLTRRFGTVATDVPVHYRFVAAQDAQDVYGRLLEGGVLVRVFSSEQRGRISGIRVTAPTDEEMPRLAAVLS